jgi:AcrR family transcriptional regulator
MATTTTSPARTPDVDGRQRRAQRSRDAIVDALFALVGGGVPRPTAQQVATRANVGIRSVFRHFEDMDQLYAAIDARLRAEVSGMFEAAPARGGLPVRLRALVALRAALFERVGPYKRAAMVQASGSPFLQARHRELAAVLRADLHRRIPEIERAPDAVADALELALSFEAWNRLRTDQRLGVERARDAVERLVLATARDLHEAVR